jgi:N utilization substance protein B
MIFCADIPVNVTMDEAIEIGKRYGSEDSPMFINGVLDQVAASGGVK